MQINDFIKQNTNRKIIRLRKRKIKVIYFICEDDGKIIYIGETYNLTQRMCSHGTYRECGRFEGKTVYFFFIERDEKAHEIEEALILAIRPKYNMHGKKYRGAVKKKNRFMKINFCIADSKRIIKKIIRLYGGSRAQAADEIGISLSYLFRIEKGYKPSARLYHDLVQKLDELLLTGFQI